MPKIVESDDDPDYAEANNAGARDTVDEDDYVTPRRAAALAHAAQHSNQAAVANPTANAGVGATGQAKRRVIDEDDDFVPSGHTSATRAPNASLYPGQAPLQSSAPANTAAKASAASEDELLLSDDESMGPPAPKRPKFKFVSPSNKKGAAAGAQGAPSAKSSSAKDGNRFYSDDEGDSDFDDGNNILSASEEEDDYMDIDDSEDYGGGAKPAQRSKRTPTQRVPPPVAPSKPAPVAPPAVTDDQLLSPPQPRKRGRPPGSKTKNRNPTPAKKTPTKKKGATKEDGEAFSDEYDEEGAYESESDGGYSGSDQGSDAEIGEDGQRKSGEDGPKKLTARQKAMSSGGTEASELMELSGTRNKATQLTSPSAQRATLGGRKAALYTKKVERTQPPPDVMAEVSVVVAQLLNRNPSYDKDDLRKRVVPEMYFNPEMRKDISRPGGNFVTLPLADHAVSFPTSLGWSADPVKSQDTVEIPHVILKRFIRDPA